MELPMSKKVYCLVDCDSFYASCEILRNPSLAGKCVCVGRESDIILASSYEAKRYGVKTGTAARDAKKILGNKLVMIPPDFGWYSLVSQRLQDLLGNFWLGIEVFSIDECFVDVTGYAERYKLSWTEFARTLKLKIKKEIGIPTSIGVWRTKIIAKLLSDINKPFWECVWVVQKDLDRIFQQLNVNEVCYIGHASSDKLSRYCKTIQEFVNLEYDLVRQLLWWRGLKVRFELKGCDVLSFALPPVPKNITRSHSFHPHFTSDVKKAWIHFMHDFEEAFETLLSHNLAPKYIKVRLRDRDFFSHSKSVILPQRTQNKDIILWVCRDLFHSSMNHPIEWRTTWVVFWDLKNARYMPQKDLFSDTDEIDKQNKIQNAKRNLQKKFGKDLIVSFADIHKKQSSSVDYLESFVVS